MSEESIVDRKMKIRTVSRFKPWRAVKKLVKKIFVSEEDRQEEESRDELEHKRRQGDEIW